MNVFVSDCFNNNSKFRLEFHKSFVQIVNLHLDRYVFCFILVVAWNCE